MGFNFDHKTVLITGAGRGLGRHMALAFAAAGANLVIAARTQQELEKVSDEIKTRGREVCISATDVSNHAAVGDMVVRAREQFERIDILVNNAAVVLAKPLSALSEKDWDHTFDVNVKGMFLVSKLVSDVMIEQRQGKIINVCSIAARLGFPLLTAYCASKAAMIGFTQAAASELAAYNIQVNAVCPGLMETGFAEEVFEDMSRYSAVSADDIKTSIISHVPAGRSAELSEICHTVMFLASEEAGYITGEAVNVSGGMRMV